MGIKKWLQNQTEKGRKEIDEKVTDKLDEEELNPTLRQHKGEPPTDPKKDKR
jgi:hypothetical protein